MCEFRDANSNGFGYMWWTDKCTYFSSIDIVHGAPMTRNKHCDCAPLLTYFIHLLLYDIKDK